MVGDGDQRVSRRLVDAESTAFAAVYEAHCSMVFGVALSVTRNRQIAEDVVQEVFVELWRRPERFDAERGTMATYLRTIAHRRAVDVVRSSESRRAREKRDVASAGSHDVVDRPDDVAWTQEVADRVHHALLELAPSERAPIELAYFYGLTMRQIAERLDIPVGTVKTRIRAALRRLGPVLAPDVREQSQ